MTNADLIAGLEALKGLSPDSLTIAREGSPYQADPLTELRCLLAQARGGNVEALEKAGRILEIETANASRLEDLGSEADGLIAGKTFQDDPSERFSRAWCSKIVLSRGAENANVWNEHASDIVSILAGRSDRFEVLGKIARGGI